MVQVGITKIRNRRFLDKGFRPGTAGCLMQPADGVAPLYVLTASHVVAPLRFDAQSGDEIVDESGAVIGSLAASTDIERGVDAALVELRNIAEPTFGALGVPTGWGNVFWRGMEVQAQMGSSAQIRAAVASDMFNATIRYPAPGGPVDLSMPAQVTCNRPWTEGDSGSVVLNPFKNIVGLAIGNNSNQGVMTPILKVLEALKSSGFDVVPLVDRPPAAPVSSKPWPDAELGTPPKFDHRGRALDALSWTLWAEAATDFRNARDEAGAPVKWRAYRAVAEVIVNRVARPGWWGNSIETVCLSHNKNGVYQFSCWDPRGNQFARIRGPAASASEEFRAAQWVAQRVLEGWTSNLTNGSFHYFADYISTPTWAKGHQAQLHLGRHLFFNDIP